MNERFTILDNYDNISFEEWILQVQEYVRQEFDDECQKNRAVESILSQLIHKEYKAIKTLLDDNQLLHLYDIAFDCFNEIKDKFYEGRSWLEPLQSCIKDSKCVTTRRPIESALFNIKDLIHTMSDENKAIMNVKLFTTLEVLRAIRQKIEQNPSQ